MIAIRSRIRTWLGRPPHRYERWINGIWACLPVLVLITFRLGRFPYEGATALGLSLVPVLGLWFVAGIAIWIIGLCAVPYSRYSVLLTPMAFAVAFALPKMAGWIPWPVWRASCAGRAKALIGAVPADHHDAPIPVEGNYWYDDAAWFVREHRGANGLELDLSGIDWVRGATLPLTGQRVQSLAVERPGTFVMAYPMSNGWWYVYVNS